MVQVLTPILRQLIIEQDDAAAAPAAPAGPGPDLETNNAAADAKNSPFTPAEKKFLGKFDAYGSKQLGVIYSISDIGIREFLARSGKDLNLNSAVLLSLLHTGVIKIVPYTGWGRNDDYTIELQLSLDDIAGLGDEDRKKIEKSAEKSAEGGGLQVASFLKYGDILKESAQITKKLISEGKKSDDNKVYVKHSRVLKKLPKRYIDHLERLIDGIGRKRYSKQEKQRLIADILDNLTVNFDLNTQQISKSYEMFKKQKKLKKILDKD